MNVSYVRGGFIAFAAVASLTVAGCGGGGSDPKAEQPVVTASSTPRTSDSQQSSEAVEDPVTPLAEAKGQDGFELVINSAERDAGGFLTIKGSLKNASDKGRAVPDMRGVETEVLKHGKSLGGATLVDTVGKKRYYVLRDTDGRPLTTTGLGILAAGGVVDVFMQFPAPPATTTEVSFQLPTFEPATLKLS
ncbi:hypothetical protein [Streptomyces sp. KL110A]|uniref:hypothetical protein n=1 Tax=Streptomyces sp. KL110A TaxID=3384221 RepID=UPI0038C50CCB